MSGSLRSRLLDRLNRLRYGDPPWARALAILLVGGAFDLAGGVAGLASPGTTAPAYRYLTQLMPLWAWWTGWVLVGAAVLALLRWPQRIRPVATAGAFYAAAVWAAYLAETVGRRDVTWRVVTVPFAVVCLHLFLRVFAPRR